MPIFQTAHYAIRSEGIDAVKSALAEFVDYVGHNEPGTTMYASWQQGDDPTRLVPSSKLQTERLRMHYSELATNQDRQRRARGNTMT